MSTEPNDAFSTELDRLHAAFAGLMSSSEGITLFARTVKVAANLAIKGDPHSLLMMLAMIATDPNNCLPIAFALMGVSGEPN